MPEQNFGLNNALTKYIGLNPDPAYDISSFNIIFFTFLFQVLISEHPGANIQTTLCHGQKEFLKPQDQTRS